jgi:hypothetical protein
MTGDTIAEREEKPHAEAGVTGPQPARRIACALLSAYGLGTLLFILPWLELSTPAHKIGTAILIVGCVVLHYLLLWKRQAVYDWLGRAVGSQVHFFELPFFIAVIALYFTAVFVVPLSTGLVPLEKGLADIATKQDLIMYVLFGGGCVVVTGIISGFDIYPVNVFATKEALGQLIDITRDLLKASNRSIIIVAGSIIVGWAFKRIELTPHIVYLTTYAIVGMSVGSTAVLGSRLTDLLYRLSDMEKQIAEKAQERGG